MCSYTKNFSSKNLASSIVFPFMDFELNALCCSDSAATDTTQPSETRAQDTENRAGPFFMESNQDIFKVHIMQTKTTMGPFGRFPQRSPVFHRKPKHIPMECYL